MTVLEFLALIAFAASAILSGMQRAWAVALLSTGLALWLLAGTSIVVRL